MKSIAANLGDKKSLTEVIGYKKPINFSDRIVAHAHNRASLLGMYHFLQFKCKHHNQVTYLDTLA